MTKAFLIVENNDSKTAEWFYADASWQALDAAKANGFNEMIGFAIVKTMDVDQVSFECFE
jgi:hypothetical protein